MKNGTIRKAEPGDSLGLADCFKAAYASYARRIDDLPAMPDDFSEDIANYQVWVAEADSRIAGGLVLIPSEGFMLLANVAVHPDCRGAGLGRELVALAEAEAVRQGYGEMRLATHVDMPENVALYRRLGWDESGRQGNKVTMRKDLAV